MSSIYLHGRDQPLSENPATNGRFGTTIKIASSPAGANMWATPAELNKFAHWVMKRTQEEPAFKPLLENLKVRMFSGEEFYYSAGVMMGKDSTGENFYFHNGGAPGISSYLRIDPLKVRALLLKLRQNFQGSFELNLLDVST